MYRNLPSAATAIAKPSRDYSDRKYEILEERMHRIFPGETETAPERFNGLPNGIDKFD